MHFQLEKQTNSVYFATTGIALLWLLFHLNSWHWQSNLVEWEILLCEWSLFGLSALLFQLG